MSYQAVKMIMGQLVEAFAEIDAAALEKAQAWAKERVAAVKEFERSDEYSALRRDQHALYARLFALAGGKGWYNAFRGRSADMIEELVAKHCASVAAKRDVAIAKKLEKAGVQNVVSGKAVRENGGFEGVWLVESDKGQKEIKIEMILAGGYNIQCLHNRVLVHVR